MRDFPVTVVHAFVHDGGEHTGCEAERGELGEHAEQRERGELAEQGERPERDIYYSRHNSLQCIGAWAHVHDHGVLAARLDRNCFGFGGGMDAA